MGRDADGNYTSGWTPPAFTVDENGKIEDYENKLFVAAQPLNVTNGSGTPLNPIVVK